MFAKLKKLITFAVATQAAPRSPMKLIEKHINRYINVDQHY